MPNSSLLQIEEINADAEMTGLRKEWDDLLGRSRGAGVFQTWEWISACRRHFGCGRQLILVCVRDNSRLIALAPLEVVPMYRLPLRRLQFIGTGLFDYLDFLLDADVESAACDAIFAWLNENEKRWDLIDLQNLPQESSFIRLQSLGSNSDCNQQHPPVGANGWHAENMKGEPCPYLPLAHTWEEMEPRIGKKMRSNLRYYEKAIRRDFETVEIGTLDQQQLEEGMDAFFHLHARRWRCRWLPGMLAGDRRQRFHREVAQLCLDRGWLHLHGLRLQGRFRSILYCFAYNDKGYYYLGGFEPELSKYSLGTVLTGFAIRKAIEHGCREFDFLRGDESYKTRWTSEYRTNSRFIFSKSTPRSRLASAICGLEQRVEHRVKHELHKRIGAK